MKPIRPVMRPEAGLPAFRKAVAAKYTRQFGRPFTEQNVMAAAGGVEGVILSFMTVLNPGDEVIIPDPAYTCYQGQAELLGAKVGPCPPEGGARFPSPA